MCFFIKTVLGEDTVFGTFLRIYIFLRVSEIATQPVLP